ncbi:hypothetical protein A4A49_09719 [Nicotiana attenuata]|uniref:Uncharacterized protein n=1 Tax=Nicotiana attenuata TaxID=49451 RepID=A0A314KWZ1_NICAT|nr:hypothetical protein A4A49_09719 [Nicotiana attenuata]
MSLGQRSLNGSRLGMIICLNFAKVASNKAIRKLSVGSSILSLGNLKIKDGEVKEKEYIGTAANSTKVLSNGKVLGKPVVNQARQEWMQARSNKYQHDNRVAKEGVPNPSNTRARMEESVEVRNGNPGRNRSPNPNATRIKDATIKESMVDWVQRSFGAHKEALNVTLNHSCQEIPSQTLVESPRDNTQLEQADKGNNMSTVNPRSLEIRVEDFEGTNDQRPIQLIGADTGTKEESRNTGGSIIASTGKKDCNGVVNPRRTTQVLDNSRGDSVVVLGNEKVGNDNVDALEDTVRENQRSVDGKNSEHNGTTLHDLVTHNVAPVDMAFMEQQQMEVEGYDESFAGNFKQVARDADLSPRTSAKGGKKAKKQTQAKEPLQPIRIMHKRAASQMK